VLPLFVEELALRDAGFAAAAQVEFDVPASAPLLAVSPVQLYESSAPVSFERTAEFTDGVLRTAKVHVDQDSRRFLGEHNTRYSPDGERLSEYFLQVGTLRVYDPAELDPASVIPSLEDYCEN
jgi:hypothetical protein